MHSCFYSLMLPEFTDRKSCRSTLARISIRCSSSFIVLPPDGFFPADLIFACNLGKRPPSVLLSYLPARASRAPAEGQSNPARSSSSPHLRTWRRSDCRLPQHRQNGVSAFIPPPGVVFRLFRPGQPALYRARSLIPF